MKRIIILCAIFAFVVVVTISTLMYTMVGWWGAAFILLVAFFSLAPSVKMSVRLWNEEKGGSR